MKRALLLALVIGCGGSQRAASSPPENRPPAGPPAPPAIDIQIGGPACLANDYYESLVVHGVSGDLVGLCVQPEQDGDTPPEWQCAAMNYRTGAFSVWTNPPAEASPALQGASGPRPTVTTDASQITACDATGACKTIRPSAVPAGEEIAAAINAAGTIVAARLTPSSGGDAEPSPAIYETYSVATGARLGRVEISAEEQQGGCAQEPDFLGDHLLVVIDVCAGPSGRGWIYDATGRLVVTLEVDAYDLRAIHLGDDRWALLDGFGRHAIVDLRTGTQLTSPDDVFPEAWQEREDVRPLGTVAPGSFDLLRAPTGELLVVAEALGVVDPATAAFTRRWPFPRCAAAAAP